MTGAPLDSYNIDSIPPRPEHHLHNTDELLPGTKGAPPAVDYSADTMNHAPNSAFDDQAALRARDQPMNQTGINFSSPPAKHSSESEGNTAFNTDRPLGVKPTSAGGVAIGGEENLPEGKASTTDKIVGKVQKVAGKYTHNMELHEKGELRESGGKAAAMGQARAPHD